MRISQSFVSKRYAKAYVNVYRDALQMTDIENMKHVIVFLKKNKDFMLLLCEGALNKDKKILILDKLLKHFSLVKSLYKLMEVLIKHKQICELLNVLRDICCLYQNSHNVLDVTIKTANELDKEVVVQFIKFFEKQSKKRVVSSVEIDHSLIAGVRLQADIFLWDYSVASRLRALRQKLFVEG